MAFLPGPMRVSTRDPSVADEGQRESSDFQNSGRASLNLLSLAISMGSTSSPSGIQGHDSPRSADPNSTHPCIGHTICTLQYIHFDSDIDSHSRLSGTPRPPGRRGWKPLGSAFCCKACNVSGWLESRRNLAMTSQTGFSHPNSNALTTPPDPLVHPLAGTHILFLQETVLSFCNWAR
jgi:hypothetical protein